RLEHAERDVAPALIGKRITFAARLACISRELRFITGSNSSVCCHAETIWRGSSKDLNAGILRSVLVEILRAANGAAPRMTTCPSVLENRQNYVPQNGVP